MRVKKSSTSATAGTSGGLGGDGDEGSCGKNAVTTTAEKLENNEIALLVRDEYVAALKNTKKNTVEGPYRNFRGVAVKCLCLFMERRSFDRYE